MSKIIKISEVGKSSGCVLTYGHFSSIHPGHIRYLRHAKELGEVVVIALVGDSANSKVRPFPYPQKDRAEALSLLRIADSIVLMEADELEVAVNKLKPRILVLGTELANEPRFKNAIDLLYDQGGEVQFHAGDTTYASISLLTDSERDLKDQKILEFLNACQRQGITEHELQKSIDNWKQTRLIVVGDVIVDQFAACEAIGMSAEAPVVVVRELASRNYIGGSGIVAAHIRALGAHCDLVSVVGRDDSAEIVRSNLAFNGINDLLITDYSRPTTFKKRYVVENQKLFRVSRLEQHELHNDIEDQVIQQLFRLAPEANGIVVSDFVYGVVTPRVLRSIQEAASRFKLKLYGDLQCSSQLGSIGKFKDFSLLCPNERELRIAFQDKESGIESLCQRLLRDYQCERLLLKLSADGMIAYDRSNGSKIYSQAFPSLNVNPVDVAGAGDSVLAVMAVGLSSQQAMMPTTALASCMASLAVGNMGNIPIHAMDLRKYVKEIFLSGHR